jgi:hypothetical protein
MEFTYILQACVTVIVAAMGGGVVGWAGTSLASSVRSGPASEGARHPPVFRGLQHAAR